MADTGKIKEMKDREERCGAHGPASRVSAPKLGHDLTAAPQAQKYVDELLEVHQRVQFGPRARRRS